MTSKEGQPLKLLNARQVGVAVIKGTFHYLSIPAGESLTINSQANVLSIPPFSFI